MQKAIVCNIKKEFLEYGMEFSDRFVYSNYFVPLLVTFEDSRTPILPDYKKHWLVDAVRYGVVEPVRIVQVLPELGLGELLGQNKITLPPVSPDSLTQRGTEPGTNSRNVAGVAMKDIKEKIRANVHDLNDLVE